MKAIAKYFRAYEARSLASFRCEVIGPHKVYLGDCRDVMRCLGNFDAVVTDPPYGIGADEAAAKNEGKWGWKFYGKTAWDRVRPPHDVIERMLSISKHQIIWGGNYFTDMLPPTMQWLIWDKGQRQFSLADFEIAWSSQEAAARVINFPRARALADGKEHPTQKPVEVMKWCLERLPREARTVLDPFTGSGTTGVACVRAGKVFTGIEINPTYFDIACRRIEEATKQSDLFVEPPAASEEQQLSLEADRGT